MTGNDDGGTQASTYFDSLYYRTIRFDSNTKRETLRFTYNYVEEEKIHKRVALNRLLNPGEFQ